MTKDFNTLIFPDCTLFKQDFKTLSIFLFLALQSSMHPVSGRAVFTGSNSDSTHLPKSAVDFHGEQLSNSQREISLNGNAITSSDSRHSHKSSVAGPNLLAFAPNKQKQDYDSSGFQLSFHHLRVPNTVSTENLDSSSQINGVSTFNNPILNNQDHNLSLQSSLGTLDHIPPYREDILPSYDLDYLKDDFSHQSNSEEFFYMMDEPSSGHAVASMQPSTQQKLQPHNSVNSPLNSKLDNHHGIMQPPKTFPELYQVDMNRNTKIESSGDSSQFPSLEKPHENTLLRNIVNHHVTHTTGKDQDEPSYYYRLMFSVFDLNGKE